MLKENQGCLTAIDLALNANITLEAAKRFLENKASEYGAQRKEYQKGTVYYFLTASALGRIFDESEPSSDSDTEAMSPEEVSQLSDFLKPDEEGNMTVALIQAELAKRLNVHSGTITKHKGDDNFSEWSRKKDPEGIAWQFSAKQKVFIPLDPPKQSAN
ncbi:MAG: hypothetical protein F6K03_10320 [Kamptonema sp. SIO4C4]|nr:hypothetical protein [Kamptonema sp. SIO4C4]